MKKHEKILGTEAVGQVVCFHHNTKTPLIDANGDLSRYRDVVPEQPQEGIMPTCAEAGILAHSLGDGFTCKRLRFMKEINRDRRKPGGRLCI